MDKVLHDFANRTLWRKIENFGAERMKNEKLIFEEYKKNADKDDLLLNLEGYDFCQYMKRMKKIKAVP